MPDPKEKIVYNSEQTVAMYKLAVAIEKRSGDTDIVDALWQAIAAFENHPFVTAKGLEFSYSVKRHKGIPRNELFVNRKEKSITRASVELALKKALELDGEVTGPKKLGVFGASYLHPVFKKLGVIKNTVLPGER